MGRSTGGPTGQMTTRSPTVAVGHNRRRTRPMEAATAAEPRSPRPRPSTSAPPAGAATPHRPPADRPRTHPSRTRRSRPHRPGRNRRPHRHDGRRTGPARPRPTPRSRHRCRPRRRFRVRPARRARPHRRAGRLVPHRCLAAQPGRRPVARCRPGRVSAKAAPRPPGSGPARPRVGLGRLRPADRRPHHRVVPVRIRPAGQALPAGPCAARSRPRRADRGPSSPRPSLA